jgi:ABC-2 type transport system permease protein
MNLALFLSNLKSSRGGMIAWGAFGFLFGLLVMYLYPSVKGVSGITEYLENMPEQLKAAFGLSGEGGSLLSPGGFYTLDAFISLEYLSWWPPALAVYAIFAAGGIVAREVEKGTMDLLLSQPVRRYQVVASKFAVFLVALLVVSLASLAGLAAGLSLIEESTDMMGVSLAVLQGFLLVSAVASYSALFSCLFLDPRKMLMASGVLTAGFYILNFMAPSLGSFDWAKKLSLFYYFRPLEIVQKAELNWAGIGIYLGVAVVCFVASLVVFQRRDIVA